MKDDTPKNQEIYRIPEDIRLSGRFSLPSNDFLTPFSWFYGRSWPLEHVDEIPGDSKKNIQGLSTSTHLCILAGMSVFSLFLSLSPSPTFKTPNKQRFPVLILWQFCCTTISHFVLSRMHGCLCTRRAPGLSQYSTGYIF